MAMKLLTLIADMTRCLLYAKTRKRCESISKRPVLQINGTDRYHNARLSFEEDLVISFEDEGKNRSVIYYPWEKISTMAYV